MLRDALSAFEKRDGQPQRVVPHGDSCNKGNTPQEQIYRALFTEHFKCVRRCQRSEIKQ